MGYTFPFCWWENQNKEGLKIWPQSHSVWSRLLEISCCPFSLLLMLKCSHLGVLKCSHQRCWSVHTNSAEVFTPRIPGLGMDRAQKESEDQGLECASGSNMVVHQNFEGCLISPNLCKPIKAECKLKIEAMHIINIFEVAECLKV